MINTCSRMQYVELKNENKIEQDILLKILIKCH